jgi:GalNAc5-diNAcBac-PP-undecaprenol beta-1,3-glucosyltransferase
VTAPAATVLVPTFDHGALVRLALESALAQTVPEIEVFLVGDGAPDETREVATELTARDPRLRFFDNPKGPRHGEIYRHAALAEARGQIVLYLADDDLWLPDHVETMLAALAEADFASAVCLSVGSDGTLSPAGSDFGRPEVRQSFQRGGAGIALSIMGHTLAAYRRLPTGWTTTPAGTATDRHLWGKFVSDSDFRGGGTSKVTAITLPSPPRRHLSQSERLVETSGWWEKVRDAEGRAEIHAAAFSAAYQRVDRLGAKLEMTRRRHERLERRALKLEARLEEASRGFRLPRLRRR